MDEKVEKCVATCRDGSSCLNRVKYEQYCHRHRRNQTAIKEVKIIKSTYDIMSNGGGVINTFSTQDL